MIWVPQDFDAFEQEKAETTQNYGGTGLGLSIVKRFAQMMGGSVHLQSEAGRGAHFWVELPLGIVADQSPAEADFTPWRAALAVSQAQARRYLGELLGALHIQTDAPDGGGPFDLCIADRAAAERGDHPAGVPLLLLAVDTAGALELAEACGAAGLLAMPAFRSTLIRALRGFKEERSAVPAAQAAPVSFAGRRILIAEDNALNLEIAMSLLTDTGAHVEGAEDGQAAVKRFEQSPIGYYDLILMDIMMPRMDGLEAARRIRALERSDAASVNILAMSANAFAEDVERSLASGMNGHLSKPIDIDEVYARIHDLFSRR